MATINARAGLLTSAPRVESVTYSIKPFDLNIEVQKFVVNRTETIGIVAGKTLGDADTLVVRVLYLSKRDVVNREVPSLDLDPNMFASYPGLDILDVRFHPDSEQHVVILTSDRTLRLYNVEEACCGLPAEQTFELRGRRRVILEEDEDDDERALDGILKDPVPVSFVFGGNNGGVRDTAKVTSSSSLSSTLSWCRLAILVLMSDGEVRPICPIAPFGARYSGRFVASLLAGSDRTLGAGSEEDLAHIWAFKAFGVDDWRNVDQQRKYIVVPHALESHVARFPEHGFRIRSNGTDAAAIMSSSQFRGILTWPIAPSVQGFLQTSSSGLVRAGVLLGDVTPAWTTSPPQCVFHGDDIVAVRSQCVQQVLFASSEKSEYDHRGLNHVIIDDIVLEDHPINAVFRDPASPNSFVVAQQLSSYVISIPWVSTLESSYVSGTFDELPDVLPPPSATELMRVDPSRPAVCHALLGDKLSGSSLFSILSDGRQVMKKIVRRIEGIKGIGGETSAGDNKTGTDRDSTADESQRENERGQSALVSSHVKAMYAPITSIPTMNARNFSADEPAESPSNLEAFVESISDLRSHHVSFCHKAKHMITQRVQQLEGEVKDQLSQIKEITKLLHRVEKRQADLKYLEDKTRWMSANVADRVQLLGELYWAMPQPQGDEEKRFQHQELPMLESSTAALATEVGLLRSMAAKIKQDATKHSATTVPVDRGSASYKVHGGMRMGDLRQLREKLEDHQDAIRREVFRLGEVERALGSRCP